MRVVVADVASNASGRRPSQQDITVICDECRKQIGLHTTRHAHANLVAAGDSAPAGLSAQRFQKLYQCKVCRTVLSRGRNTGWTQAGTSFVAYHDPEARVRAQTPGAPGNPT